jgi:hypothetical protein
VTPRPAWAKNKFSLLTVLLMAPQSPGSHFFIFLA